MKSEKKTIFTVFKDIKSAVNSLSRIEYYINARIYYIIIIQCMDVCISFVVST